MAFSADELRVLRGALAAAVLPGSAPSHGAEEYTRLADAVDETAGEADRLRAFLLADLARYRDALPGSAAGFLGRLEDALATGYLPGPEDLAVLRTLASEAAGEAERDRRSALLRRCERLAEQALRAQLLLLPGGRTGAEDRRAPECGAQRDEGEEGEPEREPERRAEPKRGPAPGPSRAPAPSRPVPTPAEVFPPRRRPAPPSDGALSA